MMLLPINELAPAWTIINYCLFLPAGLASPKLHEGAAGRDY